MSGIFSAASLWSVPAPLSLQDQVSASPAGPWGWTEMAPVTLVPLFQAPHHLPARLELSSSKQPDLLLGTQSPLLSGPNTLPPSQHPTHRAPICLFSQATWPCAGPRPARCLAPLPRSHRVPLLHDAPYLSCLTNTLRPLCTRDPREWPWSEPLQHAASTCQIHGL